MVKFSTDLFWIGDTETAVCVMSEKRYDFAASWFFQIYNFGGAN